MVNIILCSESLRGVGEKCGNDVSALFMPSSEGFQERLASVKERLDSRWSIAADLADPTLSTIFDAISSARVSCSVAYFTTSEDRGSCDRNGLLDLPRVFPSVFMVHSGEISESVETALVRLLKVHHQEQLRKFIFSKDLGFRVAYAWPLAVPEGLGGNDPQADRVRIQQGLFPRAFEASEFLLDDLKERMENVSARINSFGRRDLWVLWGEHLQVYHRLLKMVLDGTCAGSMPFDGLRRAREAELLLTGAISECKEMLAGDEPDFAAIFYGEEAEGLSLKGRVHYYRAKLDALNSEAEASVECFLNSSADGYQYARFKRQDFKARIIRNTDVASVHGACRQLLGHMLRVVDAPEFRRMFLLDLLRWAWRRDSASTRMERLDDFLRSVHLRIQSLKGERIIVAVPRSFLNIWRGRFNPGSLGLGQTVEILAIDGTEGWLYIDRPLMLGELVRRPLESRSSSKVIASTDYESATVEQALEQELGVPLRETFAVCSACGLDALTPIPEKPIRVEKMFEQAPPVSCPKCHRPNIKDWWFCNQHDKIVLPVPRDKVRCPNCILRHHNEPVRYPLSSVGVRPGFVEAITCPHCVELRKERPWHNVFNVPEALVPFYTNGVNGHDSDNFCKLADLHGLLDGYRCPACATLLIPVDHRMDRHKSSLSSLL